MGGALYWFCSLCLHICDFVQTVNERCEKYKTNGSKQTIKMPSNAKVRLGQKKEKTSIYFSVMPFPLEYRVVVAHKCYSGRKKGEKFLLFRPNIKTTKNNNNTKSQQR